MLNLVENLGQKCPFLVKKRKNMQIKETRARTVCVLTAAQKLASAEKIKKLQKDGEKLIKGMFEFTDAGGGWLDFSYRFYPGEPIRTVKITHGEVCDIPIDLAKHLNNCYKKIRLMREKADEGVDTVTKTSRTRFTPMDIM
jgi:hypothetical protein